MRRIISAMQISVDGYIEDRDGKLDWVDTWEDEYGFLDQVDTCVLGSVMYPGYEEYIGQQPSTPRGNCLLAANCRRLRKSNMLNGLPKHPI
jgi:dihydrofolate reductase